MNEAARLAKLPGQLRGRRGEPHRGAAAGGRRRLRTAGGTGTQTPEHVKY